MPSSLGPIIMISESKAIIFLKKNAFLESIVSCAYVRVYKSVLGGSHYKKEEKKI
jgi:hypothetical protein